jgi:hypothetical protein
MLYKYTTLILGAMLGISTLAFSGASASAAAMLPLSSPASGEMNAVNDGIVQVKNKNDSGNYYGNGSWNKKHFNNNCYYKNGGCRNFNRNNHFYRYNNFHRRNHFSGSNFVLPLIIGGGFGAYDYYDYDYGYARASNKHVRWCLNRYRSYNPRTNLWKAYSGKKYQCDSPYY